MHSLKQLWSHLRASFWFAPTLVVAGSIVLALALIEAEPAVDQRWLADWPRVFGATPEGARQLLSTIAGSMMTVMGVTFSMTLVALTLASSQYSSRILRNFMRSRVTQSTLGIFAGIFTYCLIVLRTIRGGDDDAVFVPGLALFFAFVLALGGVGVLIYFIHHIASSIQASSIIASVADETMTVIDQLFPTRLENADEEEDEEEVVVASPVDATWRTVPAATDGYIQDVDYAALIRVAAQHETCVRMERGIGDFVVRDTALSSLAQGVPLDEKTIACVNAAYSFSSQRTVDQDPRFGLRQIVDIALKALSPGVNDTSTAVMCVDYLTAILSRLADRQLPSTHRYEGETLRLIAMEARFARLLGEAFDQIRRNAAGNVAIMSRMLGALDAIGSQTNLPRRRQALRRQAESIAELAERTIESVADRARIKVRFTRVQGRLETAPVGGSVPVRAGGIAVGA